MYINFFLRNRSEFQINNGNSSLKPPEELTQSKFLSSFSAQNTSSACNQEKVNQAYQKTIPFNIQANSGIVTPIASAKTSRNNGMPYQKHITDAPITRNASLLNATVVSKQATIPLSKNVIRTCSIAKKVTLQPIVANYPGKGKKIPPPLPPRSYKNSKESEEKKWEEINEIFNTCLAFIEAEEKR